MTTTIEKSPLIVSHSRKDQGFTKENIPNQSKKNMGLETVQNKSSKMKNNAGIGPKQNKNQDAIIKKYNANDSITKEDIFQNIEVVEPEEDQDLDLSKSTMSLEGKPKSKEEVTIQIMTNLEKEIEKLKNKKDFGFAIKTEKDIEQFRETLHKQAKFEEDENSLHQNPYVYISQKAANHSSSSTKSSVGNIESLMKVHMNKIANLEDQYNVKRMQSSYILERSENLKNRVILQEDNIKDNLAKPKENSIKTRGNSAKVTSKKATEVTNAMIGAATTSTTKGYRNKPEEVNVYTKLQPPPAMNSYMINEYIMDQKKNRRVDMKKPSHLKNFQEKFEEYLIIKQQKLEEKNILKEIKSNIEFNKANSPNKHQSKTPNKHDNESRLSVEAKGNTIKVFKQKGSNNKNDLMKSVNIEIKQNMNKQRPKSAKKYEEIIEKDELELENEDKQGEITEKEYDLLHIVYNMMPKNEADLVHKNDIYDCIIQNPQLIELYDINLETIGDDLVEFDTEIADIMNFNEFISFLKQSRKIVGNMATSGGTNGGIGGAGSGSSSIIIKKKKSGGINPVNAEASKGIQNDISKKPSNVKENSQKIMTVKQTSNMENKFKNVCLLSKEILDIFKEIYQNLNKNDGLGVNKTELIKNIREDSRISKDLNKDAIHLGDFDKSLTLDKVLAEIEESEFKMNSDQKKLKDYITFNQFMKFFTNYQIPEHFTMVENIIKASSSPDKRAAEKISESILKSQANFKEKEETMKIIDKFEEDFIDLTPEIKRFLEEIFESMPKTVGYVRTTLLTNKIKSDTRYDTYKTMICRQKSSKSSSLNEETLEEIINRIEKEADNNIEFDEFMAFFSRRGRPRSLMYKYARNLDEQIIIEDTYKYTQSNLGISNGNMKVIEYDTVCFTTNKTKDIPYNIKSSKSKQEYYKEIFEADNDENDINEGFEIMITPKKSKNRKFLKYKRGTSLGNTEVIKEFDQQEICMSENDIQEKTSNIYYRNIHDMKFTIPEPFYFDLRDQLKKQKKTIAEIKFEQMMDQKKLEELRVKNYIFRAKSVPFNIKIPLFEQIMKAQEERRKMVKAESIAITKMNERPFNFYLRDKNKPSKPEYELNEEFKHKFKAKPVPAICTVKDVWKKKAERDEIERRERVMKLAEENLLLASLPPRMAKYEKEKKSMESKSQDDIPKWRFRANPVPEFEKLHKMFQELLESKRKSKIQTVPVPFNFQESKKGVPREYLDLENQYKQHISTIRRDPMEAVVKLKKIKPKYQPPTTKKMVAMMDKLKQERYENEMKEDLKRKEEQERLNRYKKLKPRVQSSQAIIDNAKEKEEAAYKIKEKIKIQFKESQDLFKEMKIRIEDKVASRPLLVEQEALKNKRLQGIKEIEAVEKVFKEGGLRTSDILYNEDGEVQEQVEEIDEVADLEYIENADYGSDEYVEEVDVEDDIVIERKFGDVRRYQGD